MHIKIQYDCTLFYIPKSTDIAIVYINIQDAFLRIFLLLVNEESQSIAISAKASSHYDFSAYRC
mgnify:CR=1 FL=1